MGLGDSCYPLRLEARRRRLAARGRAARSPRGFYLWQECARRSPGKGLRFVLRG